MRKRDEQEDDLQTPQPLGKICASLFAPRIDAEEIDVVEVPDEGAVEIQADEWTLHLQGDPLVLAFVAIENEPEQGDALDQALRDAISPPDLALLRTLNRQLGGELANRLAASGDPLSAALGEMLASDAAD